MSTNTQEKILSATEKVVLRELQYRHTMNLKGSFDTETFSYRQYLRIIDKLFDKGIITDWVPILHPFASTYKKLVWFFVRTNPRDPKDLDFLRSLGGQVLSLDGIAGPYSLSALIQFSSDQDFNNSLATIDNRFATPNPVYQNIRYQWLEIIAFYKYKGFSITNAEPYVQKDQKLPRILLEVGSKQNRPPTIEDVAHEEGVATSTIQKQLKQLEESKTILGYSVVIHSNLRPQIKAIIQFHVHPGSYSNVISVLIEDPLVSLLCKIQKESFNLLAVVYTQSIQDLNTWVTDLYSHEAILDTLTTIVLKNELMTGDYEHFPIL